MDFSLHTYKEGEETKVVKFLSSVFGIDYPLDLWHWKYKDHGLGTYEAIAKLGEEIIGHFGGLPRRVYYKGKYGLSALICDVAVSPKYRGLFRRKGIFYYLFHKFIEEYGSEDLEKRVFILGYGFPTLKARKLALKLGLYEDVEKVAEFLFYRTRIKKININFSFLRDLGQDYKVVDALWNEMFNSLSSIMGKDFIVNLRNSSFLKWRIKQPNAKFKVRVIYKFFKPKALFLIRTDKEIPLLYDYIGDLRNLGENLEILIEKDKYNILKVRFPLWIESFLKNLKYDKLNTDTFLVANKITGPRASEIKGKFFYSFGDEDV